MQRHSSKVRGGFHPALMMMARTQGALPVHGLQPRLSLLGGSVQLPLAGPGARARGSVVLPLPSGAPGAAMTSAMHPGGGARYSSVLIPSKPDDALYTTVPTLAQAGQVFRGALDRCASPVRNARGASPVRAVRGVEPVRQIAGSAIIRGSSPIRPSAAHRGASALCSVALLQPAAKSTIYAPPDMLALPGPSAGALSVVAPSISEDGSSIYTPTGSARIPPEGEPSTPSFNRGYGITSMTDNTCIIATSETEAQCTKKAQGSAEFSPCASLGNENWQDDFVSMWWGNGQAPMLAN